MTIFDSRPFLIKRWVFQGFDTTKLISIRNITIFIVQAQEGFKLVLRSLCETDFEFSVPPFPHNPNLKLSAFHPGPKLCGGTLVVFSLRQT